MGEEAASLCSGSHSLGGQCGDLQEERVYMDYNATTPLESEVIAAVTEAMHEAWGNPSSSYLPGRKAKAIINSARENVARMVGGRAEDIIFVSGGTEANNLVFHTAVKNFWESSGASEMNGLERSRQNGKSLLPHIITSNVEHDSVTLAAESLVREGKADVTYVPVSKVTARVEVEDVMAAVRPTTCLISVMLANNETGVLMPIRALSQRVKSHNRQQPSHRILLHTDAAQAIGKVQVDVQELGVDYLTIVGHKFYAPRIGALYMNGPGKTTPVFPMLFGGGQERNFRPGAILKAACLKNKQEVKTAAVKAWQSSVREETQTENTPMIAGLGKAAELVNLHLMEYEAHMRDIRLYLEQRLLDVFGKEKIHFNSHFAGSESLPNTCNVSILGPGLQGRRVLSRCKKLLASVGAACHSDRGDRPSHILLSSGIPAEVATNALRLSVGRGTTRKDVDLVVEDLRKVVQELEEQS